MPVDERKAVVLQALLRHLCAAGLRDVGAADEQKLLAPELLELIADAAYGAVAENNGVKLSILENAHFFASFNIVIKIRACTKIQYRAIIQITSAYFKCA